jgi:hypothetical protein
MHAVLTAVMFASRILRESELNAAKHAGLREDDFVTTVEKKACVILSGIAGVEGCWVLANLWVSPGRFWQWTGFAAPRQAGLAGWGLALAVAAFYLALCARLPSVRRNLARPSLLKLLALLVAVAAGLCEEGVFRKLFMDALAQRGSDLALQLIASAVAFGAVHAVWGLLRGSLRTALGAMIATGSFGFLLAVLYAVSQRNLAPSISAHFIVNFFAEPGLVLAALSGEMGRSRPAPAGAREDRQ